MNKKQEFPNAVEILAPNDQFIHGCAQCVSEESLPERPGGAALEFVVAMQHLTAVAPEILSRPQQRAKTSSESADGLSLGHALRVKSAEYWLRLGEPAQAMMELGRLPESAKRHRSVVKVLLSVHRALREMNQYTTAA